MKNFQLTLNFAKCSWLKYFYKNQFGEVVKVLPKGPSVHGKEIPEERVSLAREVQVLDVWTPVSRLRCGYGELMEFFGEEAKSIKKAYDAFIYRKVYGKHDKPKVG